MSIAIDGSRPRGCTATRCSASRRRLCHTVARAFDAVHCAGVIQHTPEPDAGDATASETRRSARIQFLRTDMEPASTTASRRISPVYAVMSQRALLKHLRGHGRTAVSIQPAGKQIALCPFRPALLADLCQPSARTVRVINSSNGPCWTPSIGTTRDTTSRNGIGARQRSWTRKGWATSYPGRASCAHTSNPRRTGLLIIDCRKENWSGALARLQPWQGCALHRIARCPISIKIMLSAPQHSSILRKWPRSRGADLSVSGLCQLSILPRRWLTPHKR